MVFCGLRHRRRHKIPDRKEIERTTDIYPVDTAMDDDEMQGYEVCLVDLEGQEFAATTAKFDAQWGIIPLLPRLRLGG